MSQIANAADAGRVAIIGMAARFPGAPDLQTFWENLRDGVEAVSFLADEELRNAGVDEVLLQDPNYVKAAAVLDDIAAFDAAFFEIRDREAEIMDPQHRLFLECAWEAFEDAGHCSPDSRAAVGVYAGASLSTYLLYNLSDRLDRTGADFNLSTLIGNDKDYLATLVAYKLNLKGPAMSVQTACSTSLVAVHQACQGLINYECDMALAGGATIRVPHRVGYLHSGGSMLSPDGHCRAFDARAGGTLPGSGVGAVVLRRLGDALEDRDRILAVIRGSAVNNDGAGRIGFTAPSAAGQEKVIATAQAVADVDAETISYVETHGTGTRLGDPIEVEALTRAFRRRTEARRFCAIGSVKSNFGHLEAAAGVAGLIKTVLALRHRQLPPSLHFEQANPEIDFADSPVYLNAVLSEWKSAGTPLRAGVSSFGFGGTNCHLVLEEAPAVAVTPSAWSRPQQVLCLSARQPEALQALAVRYAEQLSGPEAPDLKDLTFTAHTGRAHMAHRLAVTGDSTAELAHRLAAFAGATPEAGTWSGQQEVGTAPKVGFLFTGQGAQYAHMGRQLYETQPLFRQELERCQALLGEHLERPLLAVLYPSTEAEAGLIDQTGYTQPALFALEYALCRLWQSWGVQPEVVLGHSVGEYVAACVAGVFSLEDGLSLIAARGRLMQALPSGGSMVSVLAELERVEPALVGLEGQVSVAALNAPDSVVVSGVAAAVEEVVSRLSAEGIENHFLQVSHAFHSPLMEPMLEEFERLAAAGSYGAPRLRLVSNRTGREVGAGEVDGAYWVAHVREAVRFQAGLSRAVELGCEAFVEVGPHPVLCALGRRGVTDPSVSWLGSLRRGVDDWSVLSESVGRLYARGVEMDWPAFEQPYGGRPVALPTYPFQRQKYWIEAPRSTAGDAGNGVPVLHPFLGCRLASAGKEVLFQAELSASEPHFLDDHRVQETVVFPLSGYLETALAAAGEYFEAGAHSLSNVEIYGPLVFPEGQGQTVQTVLTPEGEGRASFALFSRSREDWTPHAAGSIQLEEEGSRPDRVSLEALRSACPTELAVDEFYAGIRTLGTEYRPLFQGIEQLWKGEGQSLGRLALAEALVADGDYLLHPALLDACFQVVGAILLEGEEKNTYMPVSVDAMRLHGRCGATGWGHAAVRQVQHGADGVAVADLRLLDESGRIMAEIQGMRLRRVRRALWSPSEKTMEDWLCEVQWRRLDLENAKPGPKDPGTWIFFTDAQGIGEALAARLEADGQRSVFVSPGERFAAQDDRHYQLRPEEPADFEQLLDEVLRTDAPSLQGVVHLWNLRIEPAQELDTTCVEEAQQLGCGSVMHLVQAMLHRGCSPHFGLWLVTRGAQAAGSESSEPAPAPMQALVWGLGRVLATEHPEFASVLVDLDTCSEREAATVLYGEFQADGENQLAYRAGMRYAARLVPREGLAVPMDQPYRLRCSDRGVLDDLEIAPATRPEPGVGEVGVEVRATGLNFRDVLNVLGMYPGDAGPPGAECAGEIYALGQGVEGLEVGQAVMAVGPGCFDSHVVVPAVFVVAKPPELNFEETAAIPTAFLTAHYALNRIGKLAPGEKVLIHSATGGVGLAAVQLALRAGAEIFATAGNPEKRQFLHALGIRQVMDSRSLDFAAEIREATDGRGVDMVLNSLSGEYIPESLSVLRPGGRFLEIGKIDIWDAAQVEARHPGITYHTIALDELMDISPGFVRDLLLEVVERFATGAWDPPRVRVFPLEETVDAFRYMQQARHIGKIAVTHPTGIHRMAIRSEATYLITGGLGALGLKLAQHLAERGAKCLVLAGRRVPSPQARGVLENLQSQGVRVICRQLDVAKASDVTHLLTDVLKELPPLRGIAHAAGILDDGALANQEWSRFGQVLAPKVSGAWNLHQGTLDCPLDFFVSYSSLGSLFGPLGQGSYAAANSFLDALSHYRKFCGQVSLSVNWGPWPLGFSKGKDEKEQRRLLEHMAEWGMGEIPTDQGLAMLDRLLVSNKPQIAVLPVDWPHFIASFGEDGCPPLFADIAASLSAQKKPSLRSEAQGALSGDLEKLPPLEKYPFLEDYVRRQAAQLLGIDPLQLDPQRSLLECGLDSLMAVELRNTLAGAVGSRLPATLLFDRPTLNNLIDYLAREVLDLLPEPDTNPEPEADDEEHTRITTEIEKLSEDELEGFIERELEKWDEQA